MSTRVEKPTDNKEGGAVAVRLKELCLAGGGEGVCAARVTRFARSLIEGGIKVSERLLLGC